jgi:transcriptional regulator with XRE-family HTH domain
LDKRKNFVGERIRAARLAEKPPATQKDISARLELYEETLSASSIGKIENGTRPVTDLQIIAFAKALKVTPESLIRQ